MRSEEEVREETVEMVEREKEAREEGARRGRVERQVVSGGDEN